MKKKIAMVLLGAMVTIMISGCGTATTQDSSTIETETTTVTETTIEESEELNDDGSDAYYICKLFEDNGSYHYTIMDKSAEFLKTNFDLFPADYDAFQNEEKENLIDYSLEGKHILKNKDRYGDKLMQLPLLKVEQIWEYEKGEGTNSYYTLLSTYDSLNGNFYSVLYNDSIDIFEGDYLTAYVLPVGVVSVERNLGTSNEVISMASIIQKINITDADVINMSIDNKTIPDWILNYIPTAKNIDAFITEETKEAQAETSTIAVSNTDIEGEWTLSYDGGGNVIEIIFSGIDVDGVKWYDVLFSGNSYDAYGETEGYMMDKGDGLYKYWENDSDGDPSIILQLNNDGSLTVSTNSDYADYFGGVRFPGFDGVYTK